MSSPSTDVTMSQDENSDSSGNNTTPIEKAKTQEPTDVGKTGLKPPTNFHALLLNRNKKPLTAKNAVSQVPSTPSNIKRLQVNKWFNSPTDNLFSPCTKKLYKKNVQVQSCDLTEEFDESKEQQLKSTETEVTK